MDQRDIHADRQTGERPTELQHRRATNDTNITDEPTDNAIVFFDIETSDFYSASDILQIAMKCGNKEFNRYIDPSQDISPWATKVHGLKTDKGRLYLHEIEVLSYPKHIVFKELLQYLESLGKQCILVAHCGHTFDCPRLIRKIEEVGLTEEFRNVIFGFVDSLILFRKKFPERKSKGQCKLETLALETLSLSTKGAHNASCDVDLLKQLVDYHFKTEQLYQNVRRFDDALELLREKRRTDEIMKTLFPLELVVKKEIRKRMAEANMTYDLLKTTYQNENEDALIRLLENRVGGKAQVIKTKKILYNILDHFKSQARY